jgi:KipI family sensor histidine kinase inhibitor
MGLIRTPDPRLERFGERALLLRAMSQSSVRAIADALLADLRAGILEDVVPGDRSLLVVFDGTDRGERIARHAVAGAITATVAGDPAVTAPVGRRRLIPVSYGGTDGPDLEETADLAGMSPRDLIDLHTLHDHTVLFLGFAPGFAYLGDSEAELVVPRLAAPRTVTRAGSVAVGESYTGIYPANLPGGWRVIGWTPVVLFDPTMDPPTYLLPGDTVGFESVAAADLPAEPYRPADWAS